MSQFDQLNDNLKKMYDAAQAELKEMDAKRKQVLEVIEKLGPLFGTKKYSLETLKATSSVSRRKSAKAAAPAAKKGRPAAAKAAKAAKAPKVAKAAKAVKAPKAAKAAVAGKKPRIKEAEVRKLVVKFLDDCAPNSMSPVEIFGRLIKEGMPDTASFRTRVYGKLGAWANEGIIRKVGRGVYQSVNVPEVK